MAGIDESRLFIPVSIAVLTVSDSRTKDDDKSGDTLARLITEDGHQVVSRQIVSDDQEIIIKQLRTWIENPDIDVVISTGGTGGNWSRCNT